MYVIKASFFLNLKADFIEDRPGGTYVNIQGKSLPFHHNGAHLFTIGQRAKISGLSEAYLKAVLFSSLFLECLFVIRI